MTIDYTPEERAALDSILKAIGEIVDDVGGQEETITNRAPAELLRDPTSPEAVELEKIDADGRARIRKYIKRYQEIQSLAKARIFADLAGSPENVIDAARQKLPQLIEEQYKKQVDGTPENLIKYAVANKLITIGPDGSRRLHYDFARQICVSGLTLHADALAEYPEKLKELEQAIVDALQVSDFVAPAPSEAVPAPAGYTRPAWPESSKYGIMRDNVNAAIIQAPQKALQEIDGQMVLDYFVDQSYPPDVVPVFVTLSYEGADHNGKKQYLTAYDNNIMSAIATLNYYWQRYAPGGFCTFLADDVYRVMNGKQPNDPAKPSAKERARIIDHIDKMRNTQIFMDTSQEVLRVAFSDPRLQGGNVNGHLIEAQQLIGYTPKGDKYAKYLLLTEPILYTYNLAKKHVIFAPLSMLDTTDELSNTKNVPEFRLYLLEQVMLMKEGRRYGNNRILISSIYENTGIEPPGGGSPKQTKNAADAVRKARKYDCDKFERILTSWKKKGEIKNFKIIHENGKKNGTKIAYDIILNTEKTRRELSK